MEVWLQIAQIASPLAGAGIVVIWRQNRAAARQLEIIARWFRDDEMTKSLGGTLPVRMKRVEARIRKLETVNE